MSDSDDEKKPAAAKEGGVDDDSSAEEDDEDVDELAVRAFDDLWGIYKLAPSFELPRLNIKEVTSEELCNYRIRFERIDELKEQDREFVEQLLSDDPPKEWGEDAETFSKGYTLRRGFLNRAKYLAWVVDFLRDADQKFLKHGEKTDYVWSVNDDAKAFIDLVPKDELFDTAKTMITNGLKFLEPTLNQSKDQFFNPKADDAEQEAEDTDGDSESDGILGLAEPVEMTRATSAQPNILTQQTPSTKKKGERHGRPPRN
ncbi:MAG: hypothetical protein SGARI_003211 [Bacillariaceae sp.]